MANVNRTSGFSPVKGITGAPWNGQCNTYSIAASYGTALYIGDPVISSGTADANGLPGIALAAATGGVRGVIVGLGKGEGLIANPSNLDLIYRPASDPAVWYALVVDDPQTIFEVTEQSNGTPLAAVDVGMNTISILAAGNGYVSGWSIASATGATPATTATLQVKLLGLARKPNNAYGAYARWLVQFNVHELGHGTGSLAV
ncbi:MAG: hypothetical protein ACTS5I_13130 [Rhodanobacter sp.]